MDEDIHQQSALLIDHVHIGAFRNQLHQPFQQGHEFWCILLGRQLKMRNGRFRGKDLGWRVYRRGSVLTSRRNRRCAPNRRPHHNFLGSTFGLDDAGPFNDLAFRNGVQNFFKGVVFRHYLGKKQQTLRLLLLLLLLHRLHLLTRFSHLQHGIDGCCQKGDSSLIGSLQNGFFQTNQVGQE